MFCVECGKEEKIYKEGVCISCYLKTHTFTQGPDLIDMPVCSHCGSYKYKNTWISGLFGDVIQRIIKNTFKISKELDKIDINTGCKETKEGMFCKVYISGFLDDVEITEEHDLKIRFKKTVCDVCSKQFGGYHEAIVQIRTDKRKLTKDEITEINQIVSNLVEEIRSKGNRGLFITDIAEEHGGIDFFISEKNASMIIAKKIQDVFGGATKQSSKNIGMKDGKQLYRITYLVRLPPYKKKDFLRLNKDFFLINSIHKNMVKMINLSSWEEKTHDVKDLESAKILGGEELIYEMILVSQKKDEVQLMDQKTYEINILKKPRPIDFKSEKIKILKSENNIFILPTNL